MAAGVGQRLRSSVRDATVTVPDSAAFRQAVLEAMRAVVPFEAACLGDTDPDVVVPTSLTTIGWDDPGAYAAVLEIEYGEVPDPGRFETMIARPVPIRTLREATDGRLERSRQFTELLHPHGLADELRMVFRGRDGRCWGVCSLARAPGREFSEGEVATLGAALAEIGDGLRSLLFRERAGVMMPAGREGPAIAVVDAGEVELVSEAAGDYLDRLDWGPGSSAQGGPLVCAAMWLRRSGRDSAALTVRTRDGEWVVMRLGRLDAEYPPRRVVLTIEPARPPQLASLMAAAHGLTHRETEVFLCTLAGLSREEMARTLFISPYTVQDHLKSIFAKTGVNSRRGLVARLVHTEYVPRMGLPS